MSNITVSGLFVYPIKAAKGIEVSRARITPLGFECDRRFMLVDARGEFITQRDHDDMGLIETVSEAEPLGVLALGRDALRVPLRLHVATDITSRVTKSQYLAIYHGKTVAE